MFRRNLAAALSLGVLAISLVSCGSNSTSSITSPVDLSPPQAPSNLRDNHDAAINRDWLQWSPSASAAVAGYEIYSSPTSSSTGTLVATVDASSGDYLLPLTSVDGTEFYRVRAVGSNNVPSAFTSTLSVDRSAWEGGPTKGAPSGGTDTN